MREARAQKGLVASYVGGWTELPHCVRKGHGRALRSRKGLCLQTTDINGTVTVCHHEMDPLHEANLKGRILNVPTVGTHSTGNHFIDQLF